MIGTEVGAGAEAGHLEGEAKGDMRGTTIETGRTTEEGHGHMIEIEPEGPRGTL